MVAELDCYVYNNRKRHGFWETQCSTAAVKAIFATSAPEAPRRRLTLSARRIWTGRATETKIPGPGHQWKASHGRWGRESVAQRAIHPYDFLVHGDGFGAIAYGCPDGTWSLVECSVPMHFSLE